MPVNTSFKRGLLLGAACLVATTAAAQEEGPRLSFRLEQRLEAGRNLGLDVPAEGTTFLSTTALDFGMVDQTPLESVELNGSIALVIENSPDTDGTEIDLGRPGVNLAYTREVPDAILSLGVRYRRDDVSALAEDLADADEDGTEIDYGASLYYETRRTTPASVFFEATYDGTEYEDRAPGSSLLGSDTVELRVGSNLRFSDSLTGTVSIARSREVDEADVVTRTTTLAFGMVQALRSGSASVDLEYATGDDEDRTTIIFGRSYALRTGSLAFRLGVTESDMGGTDLIGGIDWTQEIADATFTASLDRSVSYDGVTTEETSLGFTWDQRLDGVSSIAFDLSHDISKTPAETITETRYAATYSRAIAERAEFDIGVSYRIRDDLGGRAEAPLVFVAFGRDF